MLIYPEGISWWNLAQSPGICGPLHRLFSPYHVQHRVARLSSVSEISSKSGWV